jgi:anti-sigma-K factor RskA
VTDGQRSSHDRRRDDVAAYALGALAEGDATELRHHLEGCEGCRRYLRWLRPAVDLLPRSVAQLEPPPRLRRRLIGTVRKEARRARASPERPRSHWAALAWRPATAAAAGAVLVVGAAAGYLLHEPGQSSSVIAAQAARSAPEASGSLVRQDGSGILRVAGMPSLGRDQVYEVWVQRDGRTKPSSLFAVRRNHSGEAAVPGSLDSADAVLVTREPRGGSTRPTTPPLMRVQLR